MVYSKIRYWQQFWRKIRKIAFAKFSKNISSPNYSLQTKLSDIFDIGGSLLYL